MPTLRKFLVLFFTVFWTQGLWAQFVDYGTDPARYKWNYIKTSHYKIIYPVGLNDKAERYATFIEGVYPHLDKTIGTPANKGRYPVVLHPGNMLSNGMVAWAPRRMELVTTPSSDLYAQSWDRQLAIHESRHVFQTGKLMKGIFRPFYFAVGEQLSGVAAFAVPKWFFEGDAVVIETAMSNSGRGRLPEFNMAYRTQMLSGDFYSFDKWFMGSYKDYTGNFYALGYDMVGYARYEYGADVWDKVTERYTKRIYALPPFSNALRHYTGVNTQGLFNETFDFLGQTWRQQDSLYWLSPGKERVLSPEVKQYTSYTYPVEVEANWIVAVKSSLSDLNALVEIRNGEERHLTYMGNLSSRIQRHNQFIYWSEYVSGLRWTHENYSVIKQYDLEKGKITTLTPGKRYLSPTISPSGEQIAVLSLPQAGANTITLLDRTGSKKIMDYYLPTREAVAKELVFRDDRYIIAMMVDDEGVTIQELDTKNSSWQILVPATFANITSPVWDGKFLYFESGVNGVNNICRLDLETKEIKQVTNVRFGAFQPSVSIDGEKVYFANYQKEGYQVAAVSTTEMENIAVDLKSPYTFPLAETVAKQENFNLDTTFLSASSLDLEHKRYRKIPNLFQIHSWAPFYYDAMDAINFQADDFSTLVKPGAMILSQDPLNTLIGQAGWYYRKGHHHGKLSFIYMGWYPVIDASIDYGDKAFDLGWVKDSDNTVSTQMYYTGRNQIEAEVRIYIPFNFTNNHYMKGFRPSVIWYYTNNRYQQFESGKFRDFQYLLSELRFYHYRKMAQRDILPRWGYQLRLQQIFSPMNTENYGSLYAARLTTYWPGIIRNHGLMLRFAYQYQSVDNKYLYLPKQIIDEPRGHSYMYRTRQQWGFKSDYSFSIFSPDWSIGGLAYIKRVRSNVFYDLSRNEASENSGWVTQSSYGADLIFDWNVFRLNYPISLGIRIAVPIEAGNMQTEALFSVSF